MQAFILGRLGRAALLAALLLTLTGAGFAQGKGGGGGGGGGNGGGGGGGNGGGGGVKPAPTPTPTPTPQILPTAAPAPDVIMRESFGLGGALLRPSGARGTLKPYQLHTSITGFWVEYPGSKDTAWLAPADGQTWRVCESSNNPYETLFTPLQVDFAQGCLISDWFDPVTENPTALLPFDAPAARYEISLNGHPAPIQGKYIGFGLTGSSLLDSNLQTSASVWLLLKPGPGPAINTTSIAYELRTNGMNGPVLASGTTFADPFTQMALRYDPAARTVSASVNGIELGVFPQTIPSPKFIGIEGVGIVDNLIVRKLQ